MKLSRSNKARYIQRSTALSSKRGSRLSGDALTPVAWRSSTPSPVPDGASSRRSWQAGRAFRPLSIWLFRRSDVRALYKIRLRLRSLLRRRNVESELEGELRFHLDELIQENLAAGG